MPLRFEKKSVLAKIEATYGLDPTPAAATNAILLKDVTINPANGENVPAGILRAGMGQVVQYFVGRHVSLNFKVDLAGAGAAGTAPPYGPLLRMCAHAETISAGVKVDYMPIDTGFESGGIYFNIDGLRTRFFGSRGNVKLMASKNRRPELEFSMLGLFSAQDASAFPTGVFTAWQTALDFGKDNTPTFTIGGRAHPTESFELDAGVQAAYRERVNRKDIPVDDRLATCKATIEEPAFATYDYWAAKASKANNAFSIIHGLTAGNIVEITIPTTEVVDVSRVQLQADSGLDIGFNIIKGEPDYTISVR